MFIIFYIITVIAFDFQLYRLDCMHVTLNLSSLILIVKIILIINTIINIKNMIVMCIYK